MQKYRECIQKGDAIYNSAGLLRCNSKERCLARMKLEQGVFCRQPLLDERKDPRWFLDAELARKPLAATR